MASEIAADLKENDHDELKDMIATLGDDQRGAIFHALSLSPGMGSAELAARLDLPAATVRKQLRKLMESGMVHVKGREVRRGVQKLYFAHRRPAWIGEDDDRTLPPRWRQKMDLGVLRRVTKDAGRAIGASGYGDRPGRMVATHAATVDTRAWRELSALQHEMLDRMTSIIEAGTARRAEDGAGEGVSLTTALLLLELPPESDDEASESSTVLA